ncbi:cell surface glycoprotein CD200 receptor 1-like [Engystomops pustulosus]|uniref:cell surface glycoprotein CD200 receptor 1-like n=1 Tax=Engystomops pustulosus TaxID=76066 RepID=UPI003AFA3690
MIILLLVVYALSHRVYGGDAVRVRRGQSIVLPCDADPGDTLLLVTWKLHLYNSSCIISDKLEENNTKTSHSSCSTRMRIHNTSLSISDADVTDGGHYRCEVVNDNDTVIRNISLQVLAPPSTYLRHNSDGSAECGATGGNPPAEISWIPHSHDINTTVLGEPDRTWSVISTFRRGRVNGTSVTCVVSHPTLLHPWREDITLRVGRTYAEVIGSVVGVALIFLIGLIIWKLSYLRRCFKSMMNANPKQRQTDCEENKQECEPYETFTQRENVIYSMATKFAEPHVV